MTSRVYTRIPGCDATVLARLAKHPVSDLLESMDTLAGRNALLDPAIVPLRRGQKVAGQAVTAHVFPGDALAVHLAVRHAVADSILVLTCAGQTRSPMFAELLARASRAKGVRGAVVDGLIRDSDAIERLDFPVWCRGTYSGRTTKAGPADVNVPIIAGGVLVEPGDVIVADGDGALRIPLADASAVLARVEAKAAQEATVVAALERGEELFEFLGFRKTLNDLGIVETQGSWREPAGPEHKGADDEH